MLAFQTFVKYLTELAAFVEMLPFTYCFIAMPHTAILKKTKIKRIHRNCKLREKMN